MTNRGDQSVQTLRVYVVELANSCRTKLKDSKEVSSSFAKANEGKDPLAKNYYIGETAHSSEHRLEQHKNPKCVWRCKKLGDHMMELVTEYGMELGKSRAEAEEEERKTYNKLGDQGFWVWSNKRGNPA